MKETAEGEIMTPPHLARLASVLEDLLHFVEGFWRNERLVFAFKHFTVPINDADIDAVRQKLPHRPFRPRASSAAGNAKPKEPLGNCAQAQAPFRVFGENGLGNLGLLRVWHDVADAVIIDIAERFAAARPFTPAQFLLHPAPDVLGQADDVIGGAASLDTHEQSGIRSEENT